MQRIRKPAGLTYTLLFLVVPLATIVSLFATLSVRPATAQEDPAVVEEVIDEETVDEVPAAEPAAGTTTSAAAVPSPPRQSYLGWLYDSLGLLYSVVFLMISFALVAVFVMNLLAVRRESILPGQLIDGFESLLNAKKYQEAYELARNDESFLGKVLSAGLSRVTSGYSQAIEAMQEVGEDEDMKLEHRLSYLALIGTISPLFGLLGTVDGMVQSFDVIARATTAPKPAELAEGISMALVTTLVGLWLAIPAVIAFNILRNRVARLVLEVGIVSERMMSRFENVGAVKKP